MAKKKKNILKKIKIEVPGGQATPAPPVGAILGQAGINIMEFCKSFNDQTKEQNGVIVPVKITVYEDRSFDFIVKTPPAAVLIKKALKIEKGGANIKKDIVGKISQAQLLEIAKKKLPDLNAHDPEAAVKIIVGSAKSMGVQIDNN